jgi:peroxiredoxin
MKKIRSIQTALLVAVIGFFAACTNNNLFTVEGNVTDGGGKTLYLENITASSVILLDSVVLDKSGSFKFKQQKPAVPDFYRLRLKQQFVNLAIDSTETIKIQADTLNFARNYTVEGSTECDKIKVLSLLQLTVNEAYNKYQKQYDSQKITPDEYIEKIKAIINEYKDTAKEYIFSNPGSVSAYFALFQQINNLLIYDLYDKTDSKAYGAVANSWNLLYPEAPRTKHLVTLFKQSLAIIRGEQSVDLAAHEVDSKTFFDISLPGVDDKEIRLSEAGKGQIVLVDFVVYETKEAPLHNAQLSEVYDKYHSQGFQIYQVSLDRDRHFWKNASINLPWICVIDPASIYSGVAKTYNVSNIPATYIMGRQGDLLKRVENYDELEKDIAKYIK